MNQTFHRRTDGFCVERLNHCGGNWSSGKQAQELKKLTAIKGGERQSAILRT